MLPGPELQGLGLVGREAQNPPAGQPFFGPDPESSPLVPGRPWDLRRMSRTTMTMIATPPTDSSTIIGVDMPESLPAVSPISPRSSVSLPGSSTTPPPSPAFVDSSDDSLTSRSEEHTSELQSRGHLVSRPLLEIKNL